MGQKGRSIIARGPTTEADALRYIVHSAEDIHQLFHAVDAARGSNYILVEVRLAGAPILAAPLRNPFVR